MRRLLRSGLLLGSLCSLLRVNRYQKEPKISVIPTSTELPQSDKKKIIIIGGGIAGCSSAYFLNRFWGSQNIEMVLLQKQDKIAQGSTYQNGRHAAANVGVFYPTPLSDLFKAYFKPKNAVKLYLNPMVFFEYGGFKFMCRYLKKRYFGDEGKGFRSSVLLEERCNDNFIPVMDSICAELKLDRQKDLLYYDVFQNKIFPKEINVKIVEEFADFNITQIRDFCTYNSLNYSPELFPRLLQFKGSRIIESRIWAQKMLECAMLAKNTELRTNSKVISWIKSQKSGKIIGVKTEKGDEILGDYFIITNGMETKFLTKPLNLHIPMLGGKGYSMNYTPKEGKQDSLPNITSTFVDYNNACFINVTDIDIRMTGGFEFTTFNDTHPTPEKIERLHKLMGMFYTMNLDDFQIQKWACLRPMTPDQIPIVGNIDGYQNVWIHSGLGARGTNHSVMTAEMQAALMTGKEVPHKEEVSKLFSPNRFKSFL